MKVVKCDACLTEIPWNEEYLKIIIAGVGVVRSDPMLCAESDDEEVYVQRLRPRRPHRVCRKCLTDARLNRPDSQRFNNFIYLFEQAWDIRESAQRRRSRAARKAARARWRRVEHDRPRAIAIPDEQKVPE